MLSLSSVAPRTHSDSSIQTGAWSLVLSHPLT
ncbi:hypothetical protein C8J32_1011369 [Rhizobium sp. PP-CC-3A-592]|nr:hypothetical protein C8J32_1011369 [Rhizobium sp. PP-CC-3A-592]